MKVKQLKEALKNLKDDTDVFISVWNGEKSIYHYMEHDVNFEFQKENNYIGFHVGSILLDR